MTDAAVLYRLQSTVLTWISLSQLWDVNGCLHSAYELTPLTNNVVMDTDQSSLMWNKQNTSLQPTNRALWWAPLTYTQIHNVSHTHMHTKTHTHTHTHTDTHTGAHPTTLHTDANWRRERETQTKEQRWLCSPWPPTGHRRAQSRYNITEEKHTHSDFYAVMGYCEPLGYCHLLSSRVPPSPASVVIVDGFNQDNSFFIMVRMSGSKTLWLWGLYSQTNKMKALRKWRKSTFKETYIKVI